MKLVWLAMIAFTPASVAAPPAPLGPGLHVASGHLWSYSPDEYISESSFSDSYYGTDVVLFHNRDDFGGALVALDPVTGHERWRHHASWMVHPPNASQPLWIVDEKPNADYRALIRLDVATGRELARVPLATPISSLYARLVWADGRVLATGYDSLSAYDPRTGARLWTVPVKSPSDAYLRPPVVVGSTVVIPGAVATAYDVATGAVVWTHTGTCCTALAAGDSIYVGGAGPDHRTDRLARDGSVMESRAGTPVAASRGYVAIQERDRLAVYAHGSRQPAWTHPTSNGAGVTAVSLVGATLFYFEPSDHALWRRDLDTGAASKVAEASSHFVISPDATGLAPAFIGTPPIWAPPLLFVDDWGVQAYGVAR